MGDPVRRLAVGTAQFGMDYGVANAAGRMTFDDARAVVQLARANGIDTIDTAVAYGESQSTLGRIGVAGLRVVTKLPAFAGSAEDVRGWVGRTVDEALAQQPDTALSYSTLSEAVYGRAQPEDEARALLRPLACAAAVVDSLSVPCLPACLLGPCKLFLPAGCRAPCVCAGA